MAPTFAFLLLLLAGTAAPAPEPVVAQVYTRDATRIAELRREFDFWGYRWRDGVAVIAAAPGRLPADAVIDLETSRLLREAAGAPAMIKGAGIGGFPCYRTVAETQADLSALAAAHPGLAQWIQYGESWERTVGQPGHDLHALVVGSDAVAGPKPVLMIMAAMHPRELATAEAAARFAEWLIDGYGEDPERTWILDEVEVHVLAQHNPDGRAQVEDGDFFWRKNTNDLYCTENSSSVGADLNRNASTVFWGGASSSSNECSQTHRGPAPGSEPETKALEAWVAERFPDLRDGDLLIGAPEDAPGIFLSVHSFGEYVFYPWEGEDIDTGNELGYQALTQRMAHLVDYASCQNCCIGTVGGTAVDQVYQAVGAASLTLELGTTFFESCSSFEAKVWPDALALFRYAAIAARRPYQSSLGPLVEGITATAQAGGVIRIRGQANDDGYAVNHNCAPRIDPVLGGEGVAGARLTIDALPWRADAATALVATDGAFDEPTEAVEVLLPPGVLRDDGSRHRLYLVATDEVGNDGPPAVIEVVVPPVFVDGFE